MGTVTKVGRVTYHDLGPGKGNLLEVIDVDPAPTWTTPMDAIAKVSAELARDVSRHIESQWKAHMVDGKPRAFATVTRLLNDGFDALTRERWYFIDVRGGVSTLLEFDERPPAKIYDAVMAAEPLGPLCATCTHAEHAHFDTGDVYDGKPDTGCMTCFRSGLAGTPKTRCDGFRATAMAPVST